MGNPTVVSHSSNYWKPTTTYTATVNYADGRTLVIAGVLTEPKLHKITTFRRLFLFGADDTLEATIEMNDSEFEFKSSGSIKPQDLIGYIAAAHDTGLILMRAYAQGDISSSDEQASRFYIVTSSIGLPRAMSWLREHTL